MNQTRKTSNHIVQMPMQGEACLDEGQALTDSNASPLKKTPEGNSYGQIFKSSSIVGGAEVIKLLIGMVRVKLVAVLIGAEGMGLAGLFQGVTNLVSTLVGFGIRNSGVRDVASAAGRNDFKRLAKTVITVRRICWITGTVGCTAMVVFASWISHLTFGSQAYVFDFRLLGLTILIGNIAAGQAAIIQGMRRIGDLARMGIISTAASTIVAVVFYYIWGLHGIVPAMLAMSFVTLAISTIYARRVPIATVQISWKESCELAVGLIGLGLALVWTGLLSAFVAYATNLIIRHEVGIDAVGIYSAAFALSAMFVGFVLQAMSADYYPRLTQVANDHAAMNRLINEQTEIGLLIALPGILATLALSPLVIWVFYSAEFTQSVALLQWFVLGCLGRVISWPLGFAILAKGKGTLFAITETIGQLMHLILIYVGVSNFGLEAGSIAFAILYSLYVPGILMTVICLTQFRWTFSSINLISLSVAVTVLLFCAVYFFPGIYSSSFGLAIAIISGFLCLRGLANRIGSSHRVFRLLRKFPGMELFFSDVPT